MERMCWPEAPGASVMSAQSLCLPLLVYTWLCEVHLCLGALVTLSLPQEWRLPWTCVGRSCFGACEAEEAGLALSEVIPSL